MATAKIVYASMTGNTEEIAEIVTENLKNLSIDTEMFECTEIEADEFLNADLNIVATYTYGDGELPDEIVDFYEDLTNLDLTGKIYGVCGSGDTFYDQFCKSVDDFDNAFRATGAIKGADNVKIDLAADDNDRINLKKFTEQLLNKL